MAEEEVKAYDSFRSMVESDPDFTLFFNDCPALAYLMYSTASALTAEGQFSVTMNECLKRLLDDLVMVNKPTFQDMQEDQDGSLHRALNDSLAPTLILHLVGVIGAYEKSKSPKRVLH